MVNFLVIYGAISFVSAAVVFFFIKNAPSGIEDENGFHYESEPVQLTKAPNTIKYKYALHKSSNLQQVS